MAFSCGLFAEISLLIVWFGLGIAMIVMGAIHKDDCLIRPYMPIFLLINGVVHLVSAVLLLLRSQLEKLFMASEYFIIMISFIWFVAGSSFLFKSINDDEDLYVCYPNLYSFAFGVMIVDYLIYIGLLLRSSCSFNIRQYFYERLG
ncbi:transmembrane protein 272-like [Phyllobates terribilis]|uniref:transmembrane protein 272-like n=1 Tax=Phyllobates terribilis TaxID=111132 RepID=UPI003CCA8718